MRGHGERRPTQAERVLKALMRRGAQGIDATDFMLPGVIDGWPPVTRLAARIFELKGRGHDVVVVGERHGCSVYALSADAREVAEAASREPEFEEVVAMELRALPGWDALVERARIELAA
jgi:hypothetical protein